jgi:putative SOS response-associated peptidase YedK
MMAGMCGRFTLKTPAEDVADAFRLEEAPALAPRYNIAPSQPVAVVRRAPGRAARRLDLLRWGLVPAWAADPRIGARMINARSETAFARPAFREPLRAGRRCLVPADGFYEWGAAGPGRARRPFLIRRKDGRPFAFAGIWDRHRAPGAEEPPLESVAVLTTEASDLVRPIHDRMPAILAPEAFETWLDPEIGDEARLGPLLAPAPAADFEAVPVGPRVNDPRHDDPECLARAPLERTFGFD